MIKKKTFTHIAASTLAFVAAIVSAAALANDEAGGNGSSGATATPIFGAGLVLPDITLSPGLALPGWTFKGSAGGMEADADGWRVFQMRAGSRDGDPIINGRARFAQSCSRSSDSSEPDGASRLPPTPISSKPS